MYDMHTIASIPAAAMLVLACGSNEPTTQGEPMPPRDEIRVDFPFASRFVEVEDSRLHYVDEGSGPRTFLLLHGQPTSVYLWRNIIPHLSQVGRVVAVDLIGFGKSAKPLIDYRVVDHRRYVEGFIDALQLSDLVLVGHDWGGALGFDYAARHPDNVAGLAFFETLLYPVRSWDEFPEGPVRDAFVAFRSGTENDQTPGSGWDLLVNRSVFLEQILPGGILRTLRPEEIAAYAAPFRDPASRKPMWRFPREIPIAGEPADVHEIVLTYDEYLARSPIPKLFLYATPGLASPAAVDKPWVEANVKNVETVDLGEGLHFLQEDYPHEIGRAIARWATSKLP